MYTSSCEKDYAIYMDVTYLDTVSSSDPITRYQQLNNQYVVIMKGTATRLLLFHQRYRVAILDISIKWKAHL